MRRGLLVGLVLTVPAVVPAVAGAGYQLYANARAGAVTPGPDGAVWFTENTGIGRITASGQVTSFAFPASVDPGSSSSIVKGPDGRLWFTATTTDDNYNTSGLIGAVTTGGAFSFYSVPSGAVPQAVAAGTDGRVWFTANGFDGVDHVDAITTGGDVTDYPLPTPGPTSSDLPPGVSGITSGPDGRLWFAETAAGKIGAITTAGSMVEYPLRSGAQPGQLATGPDGAIWFTDGSGIGRITTSGASSSFQPQNCSGCNDVNGIAAGADGRVWYTQNYYGDGSVVAMTPGGQVSRFKVPSLGNEVFFFADAITAGPDGRMWFSLAADSPGGIGAVTPDTVGGGRGPVTNNSGAACIVPKLRGKSLTSARHALTMAHCRLGKVTKRQNRRVHRGRVIKSRPGAGSHLSAGSKVSLVVAR
jgi:virginiamycin B lyase